MNNTENIIDVCLLTIGSAYSLANLEHILGVIILVLQLVWILSKFINKIVKSIKKKKMPQIEEHEVKELQNVLEDLSEVIREEETDGK